MPAAADFLYHPLTTFWQLVEVYKLDVAKTSAETAEKRRRNTEDVQKRTTYRIAHGLQEQDSQGLGAWPVKNDGETLGPEVKAHRVIDRPVGVEPGQELEFELAVRRGNRGDSRQRDLDMERRPVKKWFGIW